MQAEYHVIVGWVLFQLKTPLYKMTIKPYFLYETECQETKSYKWD